MIIAFWNALFVNNPRYPKYFENSFYDPFLALLLAVLFQALILDNFINLFSAEEVVRKLYTNILVVGGSAKIEGFSTWLQNRIALKIPIEHRGGKSLFRYVSLLSGIYYSCYLYGP